MSAKTLEDSCDDAVTAFTRGRKLSAQLRDQAALNALCKHLAGAVQADLDV